MRRLISTKFGIVIRPRVDFVPYFTLPYLRGEQAQTPAQR